MQEFEGSYSDGQSAASYDAQISFGHDALIIRFADGNRRSWPYGELQSSHPVHPEETVLIGNRQRPGERLQVNINASSSASGDFARELISRAPQLSRKAAGWRLFFPMAAATLLILLAGFWLWFGEHTISQTMARWIPQSVRAQMGKHVVEQLAPARKICHSDAGDTALKAMADRINPNEVNGHFSIRVARLGVINAFAAPGENIILSNKLIAFAKSPDEVAGVLAHEMGHGIETHPEAGIIRALGISTAISILLGGASDNLASLGAMLLQMNYSRKAEKEADAHALRILKEAGIAPEPLAELFARIDNKIMKNGGKFKRTVMRILSTHPATGERVDMIKHEGEWPSTSALNNEQWQALRKICD